MANSDRTDLSNSYSPPQQFQRNGLDSPLRVVKNRPMLGSPLLEYSPLDNLPNILDNPSPVPDSWGVPELHPSVRYGIHLTFGTVVVCSIGYCILSSYYDECQIDRQKLAAMLLQATRSAVVYPSGHLQ